MENFMPLFKEKDKNDQQYYFKDGEWKECEEDRVMSLYGYWVISKGAERYYNEDGYLVYGLLTK